MNPLYFLLLIPILAPLIALQMTGRFTRDMLPLAAAFSAGGALVLGLIIMAFTSYTSSDTEVLTGYVTTKEINRFSCATNTSNPCQNDFPCHCRVISYECGTDKTPETCSRTECDRCYTYSWEQNFYIDSSLQGERAYKISRIDPQGMQTPPRWAAVHHGDPVSITNTYDSYLLDAANSVFAQDGAAEEKYKAKIPTYPLRIYDYYKIDRLVTVGKVRVDDRKWNEEISRALAQVGPRKQANIVVVIAEGVGMDFANAVRRAWKGFKKNDIVIFVGVDTEGKLVWTRTMSWSKASIVNVTMENELLMKFEGKVLEPVSFMATAKAVALAHFERRSMEEFKYLKAESELSTTQSVWLWIFTFLIPIGTVVGLIHLTNGVTLRDIRMSQLLSFEQMRQSRPKGFQSSTARIKGNTRFRT